MERNLRKNLMVVIILLLALGFRFLLEFIFISIWDFFDLSTFTGFFVRTLFVVVFLVIWFSITLRSDNPHQKLPWLLLLTFEPVLGITLFLTFGRSFKQSRRYRKRPYMQGRNYITQEASPEDFSYQDDAHAEIFKAAHHCSHHQPFYQNTAVEVFKNGETFYPALIQDLKAAKHTILFEFFIFRHDETSRQFADILKQKAKEGLQVKVIIDGLGSARTKRSFLKDLRSAGVDLIINDKIYFPLFNTRINYRNHRKIVVIDGLVGYLGGMNIADEYDNTIAYHYHFRDTQMKLTGPANHSLTALFLKDYYYNTGVFIDDALYYPKASPTLSNHTVQIIESGPDSNSPTIRDLYIKLMMNAKKSIKIMTPYMALDQETLSAIKLAAGSGITVDIIVPGVPDKYIVYKVTKAYISNLMASGVHIHEFKKGFCHAKILIVDDEIASVGSYNLDYRSAIIDFEVSALVKGDAVKTLTNQFNEDLEVSREIEKKQWRKRPLFSKVLEGIMSIFTPII